MSRYLRQASSDEEQHASNLELFYDLVFVFAVTQVSHLLLHDLTWHGAGRALLVLLVVWWAWNYTTWVTNQLDPDAVPVRLLVLAIMLASLVMAVAIPAAFGAARCSSPVRTSRSRSGGTPSSPSSSRIAARPSARRRCTSSSGSCAAGVFWIAGALASDTVQVVLWLVALAIDYSAPLFLYRVPGRPKLPPSSWQVETSHFAERFQLFIIIALGESIVITGATTAQLELDTARMAALGVAFVSTAALWWLYFSYVARIAERRLELADDRTTTARDAYTYLHVLFVAGIIVAAVGDELVIAHPGDELPTAELVAVVAGPVIYLLAHVLFRLRLARSLSWRRSGLPAPASSSASAEQAMPALAVAALLALVLVVLIVWEDRAARHRRRRGERSPLEQLDAEEQRAG